MQIIYSIFNVILDAGAVVMLPIIITIVGLIFGVKLAKAFRSGLTIGIGFCGINLVVDMLKSNLGPAAQAMVENFGINLDILDVGWGAIAAVTWSSPIIAILIFCILAVNIIMLALNATNTLDVDIWNYHHMAIVGIMVYFVTNNVILGIAATVVMAIVTFKLSDWTAPLVEEYFGIPGVSLPTMSALSSVVIAAPLNWLMDRIPGINKLNFEIKDAKKISWILWRADHDGSDSRLHHRRSCKIFRRRYSCTRCEHGGSSCPDPEDDLSVHGRSYADL